MSNAPIHAETDRFVGALLGAALGDVLGWPHEDRANRVGGNNPAQRLEMADWAKRSGGRFQPHEELIEAGAYSDDTQLIIAVARCRLDGGDWWKRLATNELPFWTVYQRGGGGASLRSARSLLKGVLPWESAPSERIKYFQAGGNGVAMRIAPHVLVHARTNDFRPLATDILADGVLTHGHPRALVGALVYGFALWAAIQKRGTLGFGEIVERVGAHVPQWAPLPQISKFWPTWQRSADSAATFHRDWDQAVMEVLDGLALVQDGLSTGALAFDEETLRGLGCFDPKRNGAGTVSALAAIFLASKHAASPFEGVARGALAAGADTDTIASMTGALAGTIAGSDWIGHFGSRIQDHRYLAELARRLSQPRSGRAPPPRPIKQANLNLFMATLKDGASRVELPIGGSAVVAPHHGVRSKSDRVEARAWRLQSDLGQSFVVKSIGAGPKVTPPLNLSPGPSLASALRLTPPVSLEPLFERQRTRSSSSSALRPNRSAPAGQGAFAGIALHVHDLPLSKEFYVVLLGLDVTRETHDRVWLGSALLLQKDDNATSKAKGGTIFISVQDVHQCRAQIVDRLGLAASAISDKSGRKAFACRDPDGYELEIFQR